VHIAGGSARIAGKNAKYVPLVEQEDYVIDRVLKVNLYGAFWASRAAARIMIKQGEGGKIINFSSAVALNGLAGCADYAASKGGVMSLIKSLAKELGPYKINVNSVAPGIVMRPEESGGSDRALNTNVLGEKCTADDIANLVEFLASDKARFITGQTYVCDGGRTLSMKGTD
ncbi:MAG: SDR family oxidoreductase, partial [Clostridia bacterium]|nr:SDR family oxidoreductase [Clostridia bacterium]